jgi:hypothetical protein
MKNIILAALVSFFVLGPAAAENSEDPEHQPGHPAESELENTVFSDTGIVSYQNNEYLFVGLLVEDLQRTLEIWGIPDSQGFPRLSTVTKITRDKPISLFLTFATRKDEVDMTYDLKILKPDGTFSAGAFRGLEIAKGNSPNELLYRARQLPTLLFGKTDSSGPYQFHISIFDKGNLLALLKLEFTLME